MARGRLSISVHLAPGSLPAALESARLAEASGHARVWLFDSQLIFQDVYVHLALGLAATRRIVFGPAVTNPFTRHPTVTASAIATLAQLHPGRIALGIGRGDSALRTLGREPVPTRDLVELVPKLRALLAGRAVELEGSEVRIPWAGSREQVPLMMAATGPRNLRLAGALADIAMLQVGVHPAAVRWAIDHVHAGAVEAGRDPGEVEISLLCGLCVSDDPSEAREASRWAPVSAVNHLEEAMRRNPGEHFPEPLVRLVEARRGTGYDYYRHLDSAPDQAGYLTDELIDDFAVGGPPELCLQRLHELAALGVGELSYLAVEPARIERVGRELCTRLARAGATFPG